MDRRLIALFALTMIALVACGRSVSAPPSPSLSPGDRIILAESAASTHIAVRNASTGKLERVLPLGVPAPDWSRYYFVSQMAGSAKVRAIAPITGVALGETVIPAGYDLPQLGEGLASGLSPNGAWLTLFRQDRSGGKLVSNFMVGSTSLSHPFQSIRLPGDFYFDAISNDGQSLYLVQNLDDQGHYQVRLYQMSSASLMTQPIVDKRESTEPMNGIRGDSVADPTGSYVYSVYARSNGPFIHALPLSQPFAWCVDLPSKNPAAMEQQFHWSLALSHSGGTLFAVNGATGEVASISAGVQTAPPTLVLSRQVALRRDANPLAFLVTDAEAKGAPTGGLALSTDGRTIFSLATSGIAAIDTTTLTVKARYLQGHTIPSLHLSTDGRLIYAAEPGAGKVWKLDAANGTVLGQLSGLDNPWAIFWAASN